MANVDLAVGYRMGRSAQDLQWEGVVNRLQGRAGSTARGKGPYYYPRTGIASLKGMGVARPPVTINLYRDRFGRWVPLPGLGDYAQWAASLGLEDCGGYTSVGTQYACSQRNDAKIQAAETPGSTFYNEQHAVGCIWGVDRNGACLPEPAYMAQTTTTAATTAPVTPTPAPVSISQSDASAATGKPNQSVPPQTALTPMSSGMSTTAQTLAQQAAADQQAGQTGTGTGMDTGTLALIAVAGIGILLLAGKR